MKLKAKERCPIHGRRDCCGRSEFNRYAQPMHAAQGIWQPTGARGVSRSADGREKCTKAILRRRKDSMLRRGEPCHACGEKFTDYSDVELSHLESKGIGGGRHNDAQVNLVLLHTVTNREQGSLSWDQYVISLDGKPFPCQRTL